MRIRHNVTGMFSYRRLAINSAAFAKRIEKLSSGSRINSAADDPAGLAISEKMRAQIRGLNMASKSAQAAISLIQTADGALSELHSLLQRQRELAVQSANGIDTNEDRNKINNEFQALCKEIDSISNRTEFNNKKLFDGSLSNNTAAATTQVQTPVAVMQMVMSPVLNFKPLSMQSGSDSLTNDTTKLFAQTASLNAVTTFAVPPTGVAAFSVNGSTITITGDGIFDIDAYSGHTILVQASNVVLKQTAGTVDNLYIDCAA